MGEPKLLTIGGGKFEDERQIEFSWEESTLKSSIAVGMVVKEIGRGKTPFRRFAYFQ
jgi:hypothetical protein